MRRAQIVVTLLRLARGFRWGLALPAAVLCISPHLPAKAEEPAGDTAKDTAMSVSVVRATARCFTHRVAASGVLHASHEVEVRSDRDGLVLSELLVEPGDVVVKGQVLARLMSPQAPNQEGVAVRTPVAGVVIAETAIIGAYASSGSSDPLFRIAGDGEIELKAEIAATSLSRLRQGMAARVNVVGLGGIAGHVTSIGEGIDAKTQLGTLRLSVGSDRRLRVGTFARAEIDAGQDCGLTVPLSAVLFGSDGAVVAIVQANRVVMRRVTTGLLEGGDIEIGDGLTQNDLVIARAAPFLRDGDRVHWVSGTK